MDPIELPGLSAAIPKVRDFLECFADDHADFFVGSVRQEDELLLGVAGKCEIPSRARRECLARKLRLANEGAIRFEDLNPIGLPIADVNQIIDATFNAVHGVAELFRQGGVRIVFTEI